jgi:hypothetical protein
VSEFASQADRRGGCDILVLNLANARTSLAEGERIMTIFVVLVLGLPALVAIPSLFNHKMFK